MRRIANLNIIAAVGNHGQLGLSGALPWPANADDMQWFRDMTTAGILYAGKTTYDTIKQLNGTLQREVKPFFRSTAIEEVKRDCERKQVWICGGVNVYRHFLPFATRMHLGLIDYDGPADRFFPNPWHRMKATF